MSRLWHTTSTRSTRILSTSYPDVFLSVAFVSSWQLIDIRIWQTSVDRLRDTRFTPRFFAVPCKLWFGSTDSNRSDLTDRHGLESEYRATRIENSFQEVDIPKSSETMRNDRERVRDERDDSRVPVEHSETMECGDRDTRRSSCRRLALTEHEMMIHESLDQIFDVFHIPVVEGVLGGVFQFRQQTVSDLMTVCVIFKNYEVTILQLTTSIPFTTSRIWSSISRRNVRTDRCSSTRYREGGPRISICDNIKQYYVMDVILASLHEQSSLKKSTWYCPSPVEYLREESFQDGVVSMWTYVLLLHPDETLWHCFCLPYMLEGSLPMRWEQSVSHVRTRRVWSGTSVEKRLSSNEIRTRWRNESFGRHEQEIETSVCSSPKEGDEAWTDALDAAIWVANTSTVDSAVGSENGEMMFPLSFDHVIVCREGLWCGNSSTRPKKWLEGCHPNQLILGGLEGSVVSWKERHLIVVATGGRRVKKSNAVSSSQVMSFWIVSNKLIRC